MLLVCIAATAEIIWITGAASLEMRSHFNNDSAFTDSLYKVMGLLAVILTSASLVYGFLIIANRNNTGSGPFTVAVGVSMILTFFLTVPVASYLASTAAIVGMDSPNTRLPLLGWSTQAGDIRVAHFFATHALHFIALRA